MAEICRFVDLFGMLWNELMVPEEASHSASFSTYFQIFEKFGSCEEPSKGSQIAPNALVRCLFRDSIMHLCLRETSCH